MSTYERNEVTQKILERALQDALMETALVLHAAGASKEETDRVVKAFAPVWALLRGDVTVTVKTPEEIEAAALGVSVDAYRGADALLPSPRPYRPRLALVKP